MACGCQEQFIPPPPPPPPPVETIYQEYPFEVRVPRPYQMEIPIQRPIPIPQFERRVIRPQPIIRHVDIPIYRTRIEPIYYNYRVPITTFDMSPLYGMNFFDPMMMPPPPPQMQQGPGMLN